MHPNTKNIARQRNDLEHIYRSRVRSPHEKPNKIRLVDTSFAMPDVDVMEVDQDSAMAL